MSTTDNILIKSKPMEAVQLVRLIRNYKENPNKYQSELSVMIDKLVHTAARLEKYRPVDRTCENWSDVVQELKLLCFKRIKYKVDTGVNLDKSLEEEFDNIIESTVDDSIYNKRVYNYLKVTLRLAIRCRLRKLYHTAAYRKRNTTRCYYTASLRHASTADLQTRYPLLGSCIKEDSLDGKVAILLSEGYSRAHVAKLLSIDRTTLINSIDKIKEVLLEPDTYNYE